MNLILFDSGEIGRPLPVADPRARHICDILRRNPGETFDCGLIGGARGKGKVNGQDPDGLHIDFAWDATPPPLDPIWLMVGLPRPQTARKILGEATALGVSRIIFFPTERGEPSYGDSGLWSSGEVRRHLVAGAEQAFCTLLPETTRLGNLSEAIALVSPATTRVALDNYEADVPLAKIAATETPAALAIGSERGWSPAERDLLRASGFTLAHLGPRVLRTETACVAGLALLKARLGFL